MELLENILKVHLGWELANINYRGSNSGYSKESITGTGCILSHKTTKKLDKNVWNNVFQEIEHQAIKERDPWEMGSRWAFLVLQCRQDERGRAWPTPWLEKTKEMSWESGLTTGAGVHLAGPREEKSMWRVLETRRGSPLNVLSVLLITLVWGNYSGWGEK